MSKTIKQNLFRFATLRNPQLIDNKEGHPGFVFHPNEKLSLFFAAIEGVKDADKQAKLDEAAQTFSALKTRKDTRIFNEKLYRFSSWLMGNKNNLSFVSITSNLNGAAPLDKDKNQDLLVWDNLIYQTITKESVYVREALIQLLIANQFLEAFNQFSIGVQGEITFTDDQEKAFIRRANASVVVSKSLFDSSEVSNAKPSAKLTASQEKVLEKEADCQAAMGRVEELNNLVKELKKAEVVYNKATQKAYNTALNTHNGILEQLIADAKPVTVEETDPKTGEIRTVKTYPDLKLPKFEFQKEDAINSAYLKEQISGEALAVFEDQELGIYDDFNELYDVLDNTLQEENQTIADNTANEATTVIVGGSQVTVNTTPANLQAYCFRVFARKRANGKTSLHMTLGTGYSNASVVSASYTLTGDSGGVYTDSNVLQVVADTTFIRQILFPDGILLINDTYSITGQFTLDNGVVLTFNESGIALNRSGGGFMGCCTVKSGTDDTEPATTENGRIYGVTNLGIADFRRVEQEVCCYVPGEVSHIENIMAREYKERSTRSLNSIETTTEQTTERETEQLTDTTTTERNEMQSEVASVVNEDRSKNYGATANMTYKPKGVDMTIGAGAYADFSSSSSTSNSNSQAQTYAQEVTERAMERIVQKTTSKRTSRILREFEENNKHGFDNTKGTEHVSGVYRWVDKIYKNKLINYGKRLMYEFAIPEPARFFKEAIWKKVETNELDSAVILPEEPVKPSTIGISSASSILESNYQIKAAEYNAEVNAAPTKHDYVGTSFTKSEQGGDGGDNTNKAAKDVIKIPKGYKSIAAKTTGRQKNGAVLVSVAGEDFSVNSSYYSAITPHLDELPVSVSFEWNWVTNVTIDVKCERTTEAFQQWQNETYVAIMNAYNERLREYNEAMQVNEVIPSGDGEKLTFNPLHNRSIEQKELKRIAIDLLAEPKGHDDNVAKNDYVDGSITEVKKSSALEAHAATVKFFEQAFDWDIMAYTFYPYFYAKQDDWKALFQSQDAADPLFQAFLQSGMARTVVPVRPGFEDAVNWYMSTGELWNGQGLVTDQDDDLYVSVAEEMQTIEGEVEGTWETRLPTSLTIIQADAIGLDVEGLPCNLDCDDFALFDSDGNPELDPEGNPITNNPIKKKEVLLGVSEPTTTA